VIVIAIIVNVELAIPGSLKAFRGARRSTAVQSKEETRSGYAG